MDYLDRIPKPTAYITSQDAEYFYKMVHEGFNEAIKLVSGCKLFGFSIDTDDLEEVIAALYYIYQTKELTVKTNERI